MQLDQIDSPKQYLSYFDTMVYQANCQTVYPKIYSFYQDLCHQFEVLYMSNNEQLFYTFSQLLAIDAQLQILCEFLSFDEVDECIDNHGEEEIIQMIQMDKNSYYRELVGYKKKHQPPWGMMFLSEEL